MNNYVAKGDTVTLTAPAALDSGDVFQVGTIIAVAVADAESGAEVEGKRTGVFDLSVKGINDDGGSAVSIGDHLYFVNGDTPKVSKKISGNFAGFAMETVDSGTTATINVLLTGGPGPGTADILAGAVGTSELAATAVTTAKIADLNVTEGKLAALSVTAAKLAADSVETAKIDDGAVTAAKLAADAVETAKILNANVTTAKIADAAVTAAKAPVFVSTEQTGDGNPQNVAHGLAAVPALVLISVTEDPAGTGFDVAEGSHDDTNVIATVTNNVKYKVLAWA